MFGSIFQSLLLAWLVAMGAKWLLHVAPRFFGLALAVLGRRKGDRVALPHLHHTVEDPLALLAGLLTFVLSLIFASHSRIFLLVAFGCVAALLVLGALSYPLFALGRLLGVFEKEEVKRLKWDLFHSGWTPPPSSSGPASRTSGGPSAAPAPPGNPSPVRRRGPTTVGREAEDPSDVERQRLEHAKDVVLGVLRGEMTVESHPWLFHEDVHLFSLERVLVEDRAWLEELAESGEGTPTRRKELLFHLGRHQASG